MSTRYVDIDISDSINSKSNGRKPAVIFGSGTFAVSAVDTGTVRINGVPPVKANGGAVVRLWTLNRNEPSIAS